MKHYFKCFRKIAVIGEALVGGMIFTMLLARAFIVVGASALSFYLQWTASA